MEKSTKYYYKRRKLLINLFGGRCVQCKSKDNLEFDHIDKNSKSFEIFNNWSFSVQKVLAEISKCQLLCKSCHKEKNKKDNGESKHGMYSYYKHHKCRCRICMDAFNLARKKWRATARSKGKVW